MVTDILFRRELSAFKWVVRGVSGFGTWWLYDHTISIRYDYRFGWVLTDECDHASYFPANYNEMYNVFADIRKRAFRERVNTIYYE